MDKTIIAALLMTFCFPAFVSAAPEPGEVEELKQAAPLHLIGEVVKDELTLQTDDPNFPHQERKMTLQITEILKSSAGLQKNTAIEVHYTYTPSWLSMEGGTRMDIAAGDKIEIWLDSDVNGWKSALSGNTVVHLHKSEDRMEHMLPAPASMPQLIKDRLSEIPLRYSVFIPLFIFLAFIALISHWISAHQKTKPSPFSSNKTE